MLHVLKNMLHFYRNVQNRISFYPPLMLDEKKLDIFSNVGPTFFETKKYKNKKYIIVIICY